MWHMDPFVLGLMTLEIVYTSWNIRCVFSNQKHAETIWNKNHSKSANFHRDSSLWEVFTFKRTALHLLYIHLGFLVSFKCSLRSL